VAFQNRAPTVLVVEDEWLIRAGIASALEEDGWEVVAVGSGEEALVLLERSTKIDLVFTDIDLAGLVDGWGVGLACQRDGEPPVVYTSGRPPAKPVEADHFFAKPYDATAVAEACRHLLRRQEPMPSGA
jgi:CheY-like chemotaxis protein